MSDAQTTTKTTTAESDLLTLSTPEEIRTDLGLVPVEKEAVKEDTVDPEVAQKAEAFVTAVLAIDPKDAEGKAQKKQLVDGFGSNVQKASAHRSKMLDQPIRKLSEAGADGGPVAKSLIDLKVEIDQLNPNELDFSVSGFAKAFSFIPGIGNKIQKYFLKYASAQEVIDQIIKSLEAGRDMLKRDNTTLTQDQVHMRKLTHELERLIKMGLLLDEKLSYALEREVAKDDPRYAFIAEELLFPMRQRIQDLQQQLAVNQQGVLAIEIIIRNNRELIRGVNRAIDVTVSALRVAVTVALALANQKLVLDKINALNATTSSLISGTANRLRTQGVEIHNQASATALNMEDLKSAFNDIMGAMEEISTYRQNALPKMAEQISELQSLTAKGEEQIQRMEQGNAARPQLDELELTPEDK